MMNRKCKQIVSKIAFSLKNTCKHSTGYLNIAKQWKWSSNIVENTKTQNLQFSLPLKKLNNSFRSKHMSKMSLRLEDLLINKNFIYSTQ